MTPATQVIVFGTLSMWTVCMLLWNIMRQDRFAFWLDTASLTIFCFIILSSLHKLGVF